MTCGHPDRATAWFKAKLQTEEATYPDALMMLTYCRICNTPIEFMCAGIVDAAPEVIDDGK